MFRSFSIMCFALLLLGLVPASVYGQGITRVELAQINPPSHFENSISYEVVYFASLNGQEIEVFPPRAEKEKDFDLILAQVVRFYIETEYEAKGKYLDETDVKATTPQEIRHLVSQNYISPAWSNASQKVLSEYLQMNSASLNLYKIDAYLDFTTDKGDFQSGLDVDPVLFRYGAGQNRDRVTIIQVNQTND